MCVCVCVCECVCKYKHTYTHKNLSSDFMSPRFVKTFEITYFGKKLDKFINFHCFTSMLSVFKIGQIDLLPT